MEHQTMSFVQNGNFELLAHELAHQWFGDKVTCGSWQDIWLNESWATYCEGLCHEQGLGTLSWKDYKEQRIDYAISAPDGSVWCDDTTDLFRIFDGRLSYTKGAMVLHQLRWLIGDSAFFTGARNYMSAPSLAYGFARTDDFKAELESASGMNLTRYFDDWYYGQGFPTYDIHWSQAAGELTVELQQTASWPSSVPFFALPVPLQFHHGSHDTIIVLDHTTNGQVFSVTLPYQVDSITFDPERWLIARTSAIMGVDAERNAPQVGIYPNPTDGFVNITGWKVRSAELYDGAGTRVWHTLLDGRTGIQQISLSELPPGIYALKVMAGEKQVSFKLFIR
jgi:hypothetical protein